MNIQNVVGPYNGINSTIKRNKLQMYTHEGLKKNSDMWGKNTGIRDYILYNTI